MNTHSARPRSPTGRSSCARTNTCTRSASGADRRAVSAASALDGDSLDLEPRAVEEGTGADEGPRRMPLREVRRVDAVERVVVGEVRAEDLHAHEVVHG